MPSILCLAAIYAAAYGRVVTCEVDNRTLPPAPLVQAVRADSGNAWYEGARFWYAPPRTGPEISSRPKVVIHRIAARGIGYDHVRRAARKYDVPVNLAIRMARQESGGNCSARSHAGARGVLQVMPGTARIHGVHRANALYDCRIGAETGVREIRRLLDLTGGNYRQTLIGYNCGVGCLKRKRLPRETRRYVSAILGK